MGLQVEHELHRRRASRNLGLLAVLVLFAALVFGLTIAKVERGDSMKAWDHHIDPALVPQTPAAAAPAPTAPAPATPTAAPRVTP